MSSLDLHPEHLLEQELRGELDDGDRPRLREHLEQCAVCRFEIEAFADFEEECAPQADDDALIDRVLATSLDTGRVIGRDTSRPLPSARHRRTLLRVLVAVALTGLVVVAGATVGEKWLPTTRMKASPADVKPTPASLRPVAAPVASPRSSSDAGAPDDSAPDNPAPVPSAEHPELTAAQLFEKANQERRSGSAAVASRLYLTLQRQYPSSREASASRLALARLMLDRQGNPSGALRLFDAYLAGGGSLQQEAMLGRAIALGQLGRTADERVAWEQIAASFPGSVHAERAKKRLEQLR